MALKLAWHSLACSCGALTASGWPSSAAGMKQGSRSGCPNPSCCTGTWDHLQIGLYYCRVEPLLTLFCVLT